MISHVDIIQSNHSYKTTECKQMKKTMNGKYHDMLGSKYKNTSNRSKARLFMVVKRHLNENVAINSGRQRLATTK